LKTTVPKEDFMSAKPLHQVSLAAALLSIIAWILYIVGSTGLPDLTAVEGAQDYFRTIEDSRSSFLLFGWSGMIGTLLFIPMLLAFYSVLKDQNPFTTQVLVIAMVGLTLSLIGFTKPLMAVYEFLPAGQAVSPENAATVRIAADVASEVADLPWNLGSFLLFGLGSGLLALTAFRSATGPGWVNIVGIVGGVAGVVWLNAYLPLFDPIFTLLILLNIVALLVWLVGLSVALSRSDDTIAGRS
jgi:hypothetical protein